MPRPSHLPGLRGVGVDLTDLARIRKFLRSSGARALRLLTLSERKNFFRKKSSLLFAKYFSAKEAFFKASGLAAMGLEGFGDIEINVRGANFDAKFLSRPITGGGSFFECGNLVGAQALAWGK